jgi:hypothetical protein
VKYCGVNSRSQRLLAFCLAAGVLIWTRWALRSQALFSWDSANYALALTKIDIGQHRPHPPGYLGYVIAARVLNHFIHDANAALVAWNVLATAALAILVAEFAATVVPGPNRWSAATAAFAMIAASPLTWFYGEIAEIYISETLVTVVVVRIALSAIRGQRHSLAWAILAAAIAAVFKASVVMFLLPVLALAWRHSAADERRRAAWVATVCAGAVALIFLGLQPNLPAVLWNHFVGSTEASRLVAGSASVSKALNRNLRDTLVAIVSALGVFNALGLAYWALTNRRLPPGLPRNLLVFWVAPLLLFLITVHIGKPGYVLPLLPAGVLVLASFYARGGMALAIAVVAAQTIAGSAQFVWLEPPSLASSGGYQKYGQKSVFARMLSDLGPIAVPSVWTIRHSDRQVTDLLVAVQSSCPHRDPAILVSSTETIDYRRVLWYLPEATAVDAPDGNVQFVGHHTEQHTPMANERIQSTCAVFFLSGSIRPGWLPDAIAARPISDIGFVSSSTVLELTPSAVRIVQLGVKQ